MRVRMSTDHFPNTVLAISRLNATFRAKAFVGRISATSATSRLKREEASAKSANFAARSIRLGESRQRTLDARAPLSGGGICRWKTPRLSPLARAEETRARDIPARLLRSIGSFAVASSKTE